jgi:hypothetical protein
MNNHSLGWIYSKQLFEIQLSCLYTTEFISFSLLNQSVLSNNINPYPANMENMVSSYQC